MTQGEAPKMQSPGASPPSRAATALAEPPAPPRPPLAPPAPPRPPGPPTSQPRWTAAGPSAQPAVPPPSPLPLPKTLPSAPHPPAGEKRFRPTRKQLLIGAAVLVAVAIPVVLALVFMSGAPAEEQAGYMFDSEAISQMTEAMTTSQFPQSAIDSPGDQAAPPWNYGVAPGGGSSSSGSGSGSKSPSYSYGSNGSSSYSGGGSYSGGSSGGGGSTSQKSEATVAVQMPAGSYTYAASGSWTEAIAPKATKSLEGSAAATVTGSGTCSTLAIPGGKTTALFESCADGGALVGKARVRNVSGVALNVDCGGAALVPAGAVSGQATDVACVVSAPQLPILGTRTMTGTSRVSDGGTSWTVTTDASGETFKWNESVTVDKSTGRITRLQTKASFGPLYSEDSVFTLQ